MTVLVSLPNVVRVILSSCLTLTSGDKQDPASSSSKHISVYLKKIWV